jgi:hypothetical protein
MTPRMSACGSFAIDNGSEPNLGCYEITLDPLKHGRSAACGTQIFQVLDQGKIIVIVDNDANTLVVARDHDDGALGAGVKQIAPVQARNVETHDESCAQR